MDLSNYETVKERKTRLNNDYPNSLILPVFLSDTTQSFNYALIGALIWKDKKVRDELPTEVYSAVAGISQDATPGNAGVTMASIAMLFRADSFGYSLSIAGGKGADRNAWVENAEESAIGRALDNMGYRSNNSPSREEMEKVDYIEGARNQRQSLEQNVNTMIQTLVAQGYNQEMLSNMCFQQVRPFNTLQELSNEELNMIVSILGSQPQMQQA